MKCTTNYFRINKSYRAVATIQCSLFERKLFLYGNLPLSDVASPVQKSIHSTYYTTIQTELFKKVKKLKTLPQEHHSLNPRYPQLLHFST